jgi:hypothetical protein
LGLASKILPFFGIWLLRPYNALRLPIACCLPQAAPETCFLCSYACVSACVCVCACLCAAALFLSLLLSPLTLPFSQGTVDLALLRSVAEYRGGLTRDSDLVKWLWETLEEFDQVCACVCGVCVCVCVCVCVGGWVGGWVVGVGCVCVCVSVRKRKV